ncbi:MAG: 2-heptaprenyl-1,4-naphthoquinone methyltransferase, partial [Planctomycetaceae bacterium]
MASDAPESAPKTNRAFYDRISSVYDALSDSNEHAARETGQNALLLQDGERVLEIGFGTGNSVMDLARAVGADGRVSGID